MSIKTAAKEEQSMLWFCSINNTGTFDFVGEANKEDIDEKSCLLLEKGCSDVMLEDEDLTAIVKLLCSRAVQKNGNPIEPPQEDYVLQSVLCSRQNSRRARIVCKLGVRQKPWYECAGWLQKVVRKSGTQVQDLVVLRPV